MNLTSAYLRLPGWLKRLLKPFYDRRIWLRQIVVASFAAATAWLIGDSVITKGGVVAAIVCSLSIRISLYKSVREGLGQVLGTAIGAGIALATVATFHFGFISIGTTVLLCAVIARGLHLGEVASVNVPVTALIVIGPGISESTASHRLGSTLIGAAVAVVFSYFSHNNTPAGRTVEQIGSLGKKSYRLLADMSEGVRHGYDQGQSAKWLARGRQLIELIPNVRAQALEARRYAKWSPLAELGQAEMLYVRGIAIEHVVVQSRAIARTIFDLAQAGGVPEQIRRDLSMALSAASYAIEAKVNHLQFSNNRLDEDVAQDLRAEALRFSDLLIERAGQMNREQFVRCISIVQNMQVIADSLDESSPAIREVKTPEEPAHQRVLEVSPVDQTLNLQRRIWRAIKSGYNWFRY